jgi:hypothetical protein
MKRVHIAGAGYDYKVVTAPLASLNADRAYLVIQLPSLPDNRWRATMSREIFTGLREGNDVTWIEVESNLSEIHRAIDEIAERELKAGNKVYLNVSSGTRLFAAAAAIVGSQRDVELYYVQTSTYYVQRNFESGIEKVVALPRIPLELRKTPIDSTLCFMVMPFEEKLQAIYEDIVKPLVEGQGLQCTRADNFFDNRPIMDDIWKSIEKARVVISDLTGRNPNVFYETGIAHAMGKEVILLTRTLDDVPFDLRHLRCIIYSDTTRGATKLKDDLQRTLQSVLKRTELPKLNA